MEQGPLTSPTRFARAPSCMSSIVVALILMSSCARTGNAENSIVIDREVLIPELRGSPNALAQMTNGDLVMAGVRGVAWAAATNAKGQLLWKFEEPVDPGVRTPYQSAFHGVVPLASGGALLCGETTSKDHPGGTGLIVVIDASGQVIAHRTEFPNDNHKMFSSSLNECFPWGDGIVVTGRGSDGNHGFFWLLKLDAHGAKEWDKSGPEVPGFWGLTTANHNLVLMGNIVGVNGGVTIVRIDSKGDIVARRETSLLEATPVRSVNHAAAIRLVGVDKEYKNVLLSLSDDLKDASASKNVGQPNVRDGCAIALPDDSVALFGSLTGSVSRAAVGRVAQRSREDELLRLAVPDPRDSSVSIADAIPIAANQFVTVRDQVSPINPSNTGVVLSWVTFK